MPSIKIRNTEMGYFSFGSGEKQFVIIPGISLKPVSFSQDAVKLAYRIFEKEYTVTVFDRITDMQSTYSVFDMADDTALAMEHIGIKNACICGASQGGMIVQCLAAKYPHLVSKAIICSSFARPNESSLCVLNRWADMADDGKKKEIITDMCNCIYSPQNRAAFQLAYNQMLDSITKEDLIRFSITARACNTFDFYESLKSIKCPAFVIGSLGDTVLTGQASVEMAEKLGCEIYMYEGYGHAVYDEAPDCVKRVYDFCEK